MNDPTQAKIKDFRPDIIVAEDKHVNIEVLREQFTELGAIDRCSFALDGQEAIDLVKTAVAKHIAATTATKD